MRAMRIRRASIVVVGAGAAGSAMAARLSEDEDRDVLLIEAGPDYGAARALPFDLTDGHFNSLFMHDWGLRHRPTDRHFPVRYPRGRVVGGSTAVNTCIALRGHPADFDEWASFGLPQWSWERCLPYFVKLERDLDRDEPYHGKTGPLPVRRATREELVPWQAAFLDACDRAGFPSCPDSNAPGTLGAGPHAMNRIAGRRISASEAYLTRDVRARSNLRILDCTVVSRVRFEGRRVVGLDVERFGSKQTIYAGEVVLCAGAIGTPGILLRSGVGARHRLEKLGVEPVAFNEGVSARLLDHAGTVLMFRPRRGVAKRGDPMIQTTLRWRSQYGGEWSDMQLQPGSGLPFRAISGFGLALMIPNGKPRSVGSLEWHDPSPHARPEVRSRLYEHPTDMAQVVEGIRLGVELFESSEMKNMASLFLPRGRTDEDYRAHALRFCDSGYHPCGTVPMGPESEPWAACDAAGRVRGTEGLRVADASLMPTITSSNTNLPTLMIGEKIADMIKNAAQLEPGEEASEACRSRVQRWGAA